MRQDWSPTPILKESLTKPLYLTMRRKPDYNLMTFRLIFFFHWSCEHPAIVLTLSPWWRGLLEKSSQETLKQIQQKGTFATPANLLDQMLDTQFTSSAEEDTAARCVTRSVCLGLSISEQFNKTVQGCDGFDPSGNPMQPQIWWDIVTQSCLLISFESNPVSLDLTADPLSFLPPFSPTRPGITDADF